MMFRISTFLKLALVLSPRLLAACTAEQKPAGDTHRRPSRRAVGAATAATGGPLTPDPGWKGHAGRALHRRRRQLLQACRDSREARRRHPLHAQSRRSQRALSRGLERRPHGYPQTPSDFLQLPGQTWDLAVKMPAGTYYFQCDPHAALGMKGHLIVPARGQYDSISNRHFYRTQSGPNW